jgi:hypothetical protein
VWEVTLRNRNQMPARVMQWIEDPGRPSSGV